MGDYATTTDLSNRWRSLTADEITQAEILIEDVESALRVYAFDRGLDFDAMCIECEPRTKLAKAVICDIVRREMCNNSSDQPAMSQVSQSAGGYSVSGTFLSPGGGLFIKNAELKMLGLNKQHIKAVNIYD